MTGWRCGEAGALAAKWDPEAACDRARCARAHPFRREHPRLPATPPAPER